ncbi:hypothetical protein QE364_003719 [Nocardioides zeae]|uniref:Uncharacterized protein n=1 Tax=Nocardioides zeae TaxID=1457234 RepID=A0ACC6IMV8_9ACTN|nr:hypothetical protein [Nocardioides zeae]MDR6211988.1 hypothetical protein [Nocardioides zeae]
MRIRDDAAIMVRVSGHLGNVRPQQATRATAPGWRDPRLWVGLLIVAVSVVVGARVLASADDTVAVWAAREDLPAGSALAPDDLVAVEVRFRDGDRLGEYVAASDPPGPDVRLDRDVGAGELLPSGAVVPADESDVLHLPVTVEPGLVPPGVGVGSVVDLWVAGSDLPAASDEGASDEGAASDEAASDEGATRSGAVLLLEGVRVVEAPGASTQVGSVADRQLVLAVPDEQRDAVRTAVAAMAAGTVTVAQRG